MEITAFGAIFSNFPWSSFPVFPWNSRTESLSEPEVLSEHPVEDVAVTEGKGNWQDVSSANEVVYSSRPELMPTHLDAHGDVTYEGDTYMRDTGPDQSKPYPGSEFKDGYAATIDSCSSVDVPTDSEKPEVRPVMVGRAVLNDENCNGQFDCMEFFYLDRNSSGAWDGMHDERLAVGFPCISESELEPLDSALAVEPEVPAVETVVFALPRSLIPLSDLHYFGTSDNGMPYFSPSSGPSDHADRHGHSDSTRDPDSPSDSDAGHHGRHHQGGLASASAAHHRSDSDSAHSSDFGSADGFALNGSPPLMTWAVTTSPLIWWSPAGAIEEGYDIPVELIEATEYDAMFHEFFLLDLL